MMVDWIRYFVKFIYDLMYSVKVPGIGIPFIYFFVIISGLFILVNIFRRILFSPHKSSRNASVKGGKNADA